MQKTTEAVQATGILRGDFEQLPVARGGLIQLAPPMVGEGSFAQGLDGARTVTARGAGGG